MCYSTVLLPSTDEQAQRPGTESLQVQATYAPLLKARALTCGIATPRAQYVDTRPFARQGVSPCFYARVSASQCKQAPEPSRFSQASL
jgi:hypothetical protein